MTIRKFRSIIAAITITAVFSIFTAGCEETEIEDMTDLTNPIKYRNEEVSYEAKESCIETFLFSEEDGKYERYIEGEYWGHKLTFVTLFETGTYTKDESKEGKNIKLSPKKMYDFDTHQLEYLGIKDQVPYYALLTDTKLTITWTVGTGYKPQPVDITVDIDYQRVNNQGSN